MTPYRERRERGYYNPKGEKPQSTLSTNVGGISPPKNAKAVKAATKK